MKSYKHMRAHLVMYHVDYIDGLIQGRCNSIANVLELYLFLH